MDLPSVGVVAGVIKRNGRCEHGSARISFLLDYNELLIAANVCVLLNIVIIPCRW